MAHGRLVGGAMELPLAGGNEDDVTRVCFRLLVTRTHRAPAIYDDEALLEGVGVPDGSPSRREAGHPQHQRVGVRLRRDRTPPDIAGKQRSTRPFGELGAVVPVDSRKSSSSLW